MSPAPTGFVLPDGVVALIPKHLSHQRWFSGPAPDPADVAVVDADELASSAGGAHRLLWAIVSVAPSRSPSADEASEAPGETSVGEPPGSSAGEAVEAASGGPVEAGGGGSSEAGWGASGDRYQLLIGERPNGEHAEFLNGHELAVLGSVGDCYYYDATVDPELALAWFGVITEGGEKAERFRPITGEQSNTSLVFDDRVIAKAFRRLREGPNPDVVVTQALARVGFRHVARPVAVWRRDNTDLAFAQQFLVGGTDGWALALTSLRDLYSSRPEDPAQAGGDFGAEAARLGTVTAEMHLAMADALGVGRDEFRTEAWPAVLAEIEDRLRAVLGAAYSGTGEQLVGQLRAVEDPGPGIRAHGDYHLGQVMRTDSGWFVLDFEGEPVRGVAEREAFTSPYKDVTGMLRSFNYAAHYALLEREAHEQAALAGLAEGWEQRNRHAFMEGYLGTAGVSALLPERPEARQAVSLAFELQKALYELAYEQAYRPDWVDIPSTAIQHLLSGSYYGGDG
jgi:maltokinase